MAKPASRVLRTGGLCFNGVDNFVVVPDSFDWEVLLPYGFTIMFWTRPLSYQRYASVLYHNHLKQGAHPSAYITAYYNGVNKRFEFGMRDTISGEGIWPFPATDTAAELRWYHIAWCWDKNKHWIYQDGQLLVERNDARTNKGYAYLGLKLGLAFIYYGNIIVDEVRIYNRVLAGSDIREIYTKGVFIKDGLVLCLPFYEGEGDIAHDVSGYGNHGTIYGASWVVKKALRVLPKAG